MIIDGYYWIGGTDFGTEDTWLWNESGETWNFTSWAPGEPSASPQRCLVLWGTRNYTWDNDYCIQEYYFVCEGTYISGLDKYICVFYPVQTML